METNRIYTPEDIRKAFQRKTFAAFVVALSIVIGLAMLTNIGSGFYNQALIQVSIIVLLLVTAGVAKVLKSYDIPSYIVICLTIFMLAINARAFAAVDPGPLIGFGALPFFVGLVTIRKYDHLIINVSMLFLIIFLVAIGFIEVPVAWQMKLYAVMGISIAAVWIQRSNTANFDRDIISSIENLQKDKEKLSDTQAKLAEANKELSEFKENLNSFIGKDESSGQGKFYKMVAEFTYDWEILLYPDRSVAWTNMAVQRISGYTPEEFIGFENYVASVIHPDDQKNFLDLLHLVFNEKKAFNDELFRVMHKAGKEIWVAISAQPSYFGKDEFAGVRISIRSTEERRLQEERTKQQKDELEKLNKIMIGRENIMIEQKNKIKALEEQIAKMQSQQQTT